MYRITKKAFKEHSDIHSYGPGHGSFKVLYFDRESGYTNEGYFAGYKYAIGAQGITKSDLINLAYKRIVLNEVVSHSAWLGHRVAITDNNRFKVPISLNTALYTYSQDAYEKTSYLRDSNGSYQKEIEVTNELPF